MAKKIIAISKGLKGRINKEQYHEKCKEVCRQYYADESIKFACEIAEFEHIEDFDYDNNDHRLQGFINELQKELTIADEVVFFDNYKEFKGCSLLHAICEAYGKKIEYLQSNFYRDEKSCIKEE
jgi:hypothetical protein